MDNGWYRYCRRPALGCLLAYWPHIENHASNGGLLPAIDQLLVGLFGMLQQVPVVERLDLFAEQLDVVEAIVSRASQSRDDLLEGIVPWPNRQRFCSPAGTFFASPNWTKAICSTIWGIRVRTLRSCPKW